MSHPVTWFQITGKDGTKLAAFYKKVFGWKMSKAPAGPPMSMVEPEKGGIAGGVGASQDGGAGIAIYANTTDLAKHLKKVEAAGGKTAMPPMELPGGMGWIAGFKDPEGTWFGLWQPPKKAAKKPAKRGAKKAAKKSRR